jgi:prolipoprotein diacylglyceryltransferase
MLKFTAVSRRNCFMFKIRKFEIKWIQKLCTPALRITGLYALRRLTAARATQNCVRAVALCTVLFLHIFLCAKIASQFFYRAQKNVAYSQNVMRHRGWRDRAHR